LIDLAQSLRQIETAARDIAAALTELKTEHASRRSRAGFVLTAITSIAVLTRQL
jgi:hypothetical protein